MAPTDRSNAPLGGQLLHPRKGTPRPSAWDERASRRKLTSGCSARSRAARRTRRGARAEEQVTYARLRPCAPRGGGHPRARARARRTLAGRGVHEKPGASVLDLFAIAYRASRRARLPHTDAHSVPCARAFRPAIRRTSQRPFGSRGSLVLNPAAPLPVSRGCERVNARRSRACSGRRASASRARGGRRLTPACGAKAAAGVACAFCRLLQ